MELIESDALMHDAINEGGFVRINAQLIADDVTDRLVEDLHIRVRRLVHDLGERP